MTQQSLHLLAARFLGQHVGSTAPLFLAFLAVHVVAGTTAVITGATAALAHKPGVRHLQAGRRRRDYELTPAGRQALSGRRADWRDFSAMVTAALEGSTWPSPA